MVYQIWYVKNIYSPLLSDFKVSKEFLKKLTKNIVNFKKMTNFTGE